MMQNTRERAASKCVLYTGQYCCVLYTGHHCCVLYTGHHCCVLYTGHHCCVLYTGHYYCYHIEKNGIGVTCSTYGEM